MNIGDSNLQFTRLLDRLFDAESTIPCPVDATVSLSRRINATARTIDGQPRGRDERKYDKNKLGRASIDDNCRVGHETIAQGRQENNKRRTETTLSACVSWNVRRLVRTSPHKVGRSLHDRCDSRQKLILDLQWVAGLAAGLNNPAETIPGSERKRERERDDPEREASRSVTFENYQRTTRDKIRKINRSTRTFLEGLA